MQVTDFEMDGGRETLANQKEIKKRQRSRLRQSDDDLLLPLISRAATEDAIKLLQKHGQGNVENYKQLEQKLAALYSQSSDKSGLEKELAEIHPHKKWIQKTLQLEVVKPDQAKTSSADSDEEEIKMRKKYSSCCGFSGACGTEGAGNCEGCRFGASKNKNMNDVMFYSGFDAMSKSNNNAQNLMRDNKLELVAIVAITGLLFYLIHKK